LVLFFFFLSFILFVGLFLVGFVFKGLGPCGFVRASLCGLV